MDVARAFWVRSPGEGELRPETVPPPGPGEVLVEARHSGVSRGTESLVFGGHVPPSEYDRMRGPFMGGAFPFPIKYGYASVGMVAQGPASLLGRLVFCLYPHQTHYTVAADAVAILPADVPPGRAVLAANMETAINGLWDGGVAPGDSVSVVGAGVVGSLVAYLAGKIPGVDIELVDIDARKAQIAARLGARFSLPDDATPDRDVVLHASGAPAGLSLALSRGGMEARIVELSWYGDRSVELPLGQAFHARRLTIASSQVGTLPPSRRSRWTHRRRLELALRLLADDRLDALISSHGSFDDLPAAMARLADPRDPALCHRVDYS